MPESGAETILVLAPTGRDAEAAAALLGREGIAARICASVEDLCDHLDEDAVGAMVVAEEALLRADLRRLTAFLNRQPPWSDLPVVVLTRPALHARRNASEQRLSDTLGNVMLLERPLNVHALVSAVRTALRARRRQYQVRDHLREREQTEKRLKLLMNELNHRVKNTLATVQSIAAQSLKGTADAQSRESFTLRLVALSRTHDLLARDSWEGASLRDLLLQELDPYQSKDGTRAVIEGPDVGLRPKAVLALAMAFHELATNAAKYGALSRPAGQIRVTWDIQRFSGPVLRLEWVESGGPPVAKTGHKGFGSTLLERGLSLELDGTVRLDFAPGGLICTIKIPLPVAEEVIDAG